MKIELVYERGCPNIGVARARIMAACRQSGFVPSWQEWDRNDAATPAHARDWGSPTILVDGRDVEGIKTSGVGSSCRLYLTANRTRDRAPEIGGIVKAMEAGTGMHAAGSSVTGARVGLAMGPGLGLALMPKLVCPWCWPLYTSLLGTAGLGFINYTPYLLPLMTIFLIVGVIALWMYLPERARMVPVLSAIAGALLLMMGKFYLDESILVYGGMVVLFLSIMAFIMYRKKYGKLGCACNTLNGDLRTGSQGEITSGGK